MKKKKIFLVFALIVFSFIFVAFQSSILVPNIIENTQCECKPCTLEDRFEQYMSTSNNNIITNNNSKIYAEYYLNFYKNISVLNNYSAGLFN